MKVSIAIAIASCTWVGTARADQCQWVDKDVAARASALVGVNPTITELCEPCGATAPAPPRRVTAVRTRPTEGNALEVVLDGKAVDLAYTFVKTAPGRFENLAELAGCEARDVSRVLRIDEPSPAPISPVSPGAPVVVVFAVEPSPWPAVLGGVSGGAVVGACWLAFGLAAAVRRRRASMTPRADRFAE
jgi:hypothetical protein